MVLYYCITYRIIQFTTYGRDYLNKWPHYRVRWRSRSKFPWKHNKKLSFFAYDLAPTHIVLYIRIVRYGIRFV